MGISRLAMLTRHPCQQLFKANDFFKSRIHITCVISELAATRRFR